MHSIYEFVLPLIVAILALVMEVLMSDMLEWVEFGADAIIVSLFAASFFVGSARSGSEDIGRGYRKMKWENACTATSWITQAFT